MFDLVFIFNLAILFICYILDIEIKSFYKLRIFFKKYFVSIELMSTDNILRLLFNVVNTNKLNLLQYCIYFTQIILYFKLNHINILWETVVIQRHLIKSNFKEDKNSI
jgi:hypothetical protein